MIEQYASCLEREWPSVADSLREALSELFTIHRMGMPSTLRRCLGTTNLIENRHPALRDRVRRVENWQSGSMGLPVAFDAMSRDFRQIVRYCIIGMLKVAADEHSKDWSLVEQADEG